MLTTEEIKADMNRVLRYLEKNTPTRVVDKNTGKVITDYSLRWDSVTRSLSLVSEMS